MSEQKKKKWGDRSDAVWLKDLPSMNRIMPCIMPNRADNEAFISVDIDYKPLEAYLAKKNQGLTEDKYTFFHVIACAIGSIICNTSLIAALTVAIRPGPVDTKALKTPVLFFFGSAAIYVSNAYVTGYFGRPLGILLLAIFVVYLVVTVRQGFKNPAGAAAEEAEAVEEEAAKNSMVKDILLLVIGAALVAVGADLLVDNGTLIAQALGVPESVIALTFVALGTSLPELVTAITSLAKGHGSLSLGNVIGANIFNLVLVSGASMTLAPFRIPQSSTLFGVNSSLVLDVPLMLFVMAFLTLPALKTKKLSRYQGIVLLILYAAFCGIQFTM